MGFLKSIFIKAENRAFDIYHLGIAMLTKSGNLLSAFHMGSLQLYLLLFVVGMVAVAMALMTGGIG
jgi:hypothetical protein